MKQKTSLVYMFVHVVIRPRIRFGTSEVFSMWYFGGLKVCIWPFRVSPFCPRSKHSHYTGNDVLGGSTDTSVMANLQRTAYHHFRTTKVLPHRKRESVNDSSEPPTTSSTRNSSPVSGDTNLPFSGIWTVKNLIFVLLRKISSIILENRHWDL